MSGKIELFRIVSVSSVRIFTLLDVGVVHLVKKLNRKIETLCILFVEIDTKSRIFVNERLWDVLKIPSS